MKIFITYAYAGVGHKKAAEAVGRALEGLNKQGLDVRVFDILDYTNPFFKSSYPGFYLFLINRLPALWGLMYYSLDSRIVDFLSAGIRKAVHKANCKRFIEFIKKEDPDVVISTHFLSSELVAGLKQKGEFKGKLITIITDFLPHSFWLARESDYFIGCLERTKKYLLARGIPEQKIKILGIPCDPVFSITKGRDILIKKLNLEQGFFNILIMSGGFGTGPIKDIICLASGLDDSIKKKLQFAVICGKNEDLFKELEAYTKTGLKLKLFGYMNNVDEFMEVSDLIITKAGGLTISEALAKKLPMIIVQPIPGQESRNCRILISYGTAVKAKNVKEVIWHIEDLMRFSQKIDNMKERSKLLSYQDAARNIAEFVTR